MQRLRSKRLYGSGAVVGACFAALVLLVPSASATTTKPPNYQNPSYNESGWAPCSGSTIKYDANPNTTTGTYQTHSDLYSTGSVGCSSNSAEEFIREVMHMPSFSAGSTRTYTIQYDFTLTSWQYVYCSSSGSGDNSISNLTFYWAVWNQSSGTNLAGPNYWNTPGPGNLPTLGVSLLLKQDCSSSAGSNSISNCGVEWQHSDTVHLGAGYNYDFRVGVGSFTNTNPAYLGDNEADLDFYTGMQHCTGDPPGEAVLNWVSIT